MADPSSWPVKPIEPLKWLNDRIESGKPACYLRFNDGEAYSMFGMKRAPETNGEHVYSDRMRRSLLKTFVSACCESVEDESVLVGSWWYEDEYHEAAREIVRLLRQMGLSSDLTSENRHKVRWGRGHIYHREEGDCPNDELLRFVQSLKDHPKDQNALVGNYHLKPVAKALGCEFIEVLEIDAENNRSDLPWYNNLSIWCAGFPAKEWIWDVNKFGESLYQVDAGSLFDGLVGNVSREWLKPGSGLHADFYYGAFKKAVFG